MKFYKPAPTLERFMKSNARVRALVGPLGSGKTAAALMDLFLRMVQQQPDANGIRPTRFAIIRNTLRMLNETTLMDAKTYFKGFCEHKVADNKLVFDFKLADGTAVESEWLLIPLDRPEDARRLLSQNLTGAMIDECREVPYDIVAAVNGRIGRYPSRSRVERSWRGLILVSNPWSVDSDYHKNFVLDKPADWELYKQPGGLDPNAENRENLDPDYYEQLCLGQSKDWIDVHVHAKWGASKSGRAVYASTWEDEVHLVNQLRVNPSYPLLVGIDFGLTPAAIVTQRDVFGRVLCLQEFVTDDMHLHKFMEQIVVPQLNTLFPNLRAIFVGDPAGMARDQNLGLTPFDVIREFGYKAYPAATNNPEARIQAVEKLLLQRTGYGTGGVLLVDRMKCRILHEGFARGYAFKRGADGNITERPDKNRYSHIHDAMQYAALGHAAGLTAYELARTERRQTIRPATPTKWA